MTLAARLVRGSAVLALAVWYVSSFFQFTGPFWNAGLGDWMDPYFINYLLEHWHHSLWTLSDPFSPPMFHPAARTLGYSHGLILYAPVYLAVRPFLHPFQAYNLTLFLVMLGGTLALYAVLRRFLRLSFIESLLLTALFVTSANISNGFLGVWSQRASVFLIPPIMWLTLAGIDMDQRPRRIAAATLSGFLAALLYTQDYYTAHFATLFAVVALAPVLVAWRTTPKPAFALATARAWLVPFGTGAAAGLVVFFWIYLGAYREHRGFPEAQLLNQLIPWRDRPPYESVRPFALVAAVTFLAWVRRATVDRTTRLACLWAALVSAVVLLVPFRFGDFSLWRVLIEPLPGYDVIRDPKRIIYLYELAAVLAAGVFISRIRGGWLLRAVIVGVLAALLIIGWRRTTLDFLRPNETYAQWVEARIAVDPSCRSFVARVASPAYLARPGSAWSLYHLDAMWISLRHSLPTLNGYSAWNPTGWGIGNPHEPGYADAVQDWTARHDLAGVCELDIEARTIR